MVGVSDGTLLHNLTLGSHGAHRDRRAHFRHSSCCEEKTTGRLTKRDKSSRCNQSYEQAHYQLCEQPLTGSTADAGRYRCCVFEKLPMCTVISECPSQTDSSCHILQIAQYGRCKMPPMFLCSNPLSRALEKGNLFSQAMHPEIAAQKASSELSADLVHMLPLW